MSSENQCRALAKQLLYDLTQLPGTPSEMEVRLGRALTRFLTSPHLAVDALLDARRMVRPGDEPLA